MIVAPKMKMGHMALTIPIWGILSPQKRLISQMDYLDANVKDYSFNRSKEMIEDPKRNNRGIWGNWGH